MRLYREILKHSILSIPTVNNNHQLIGSILLIGYFPIIFTLGLSFKILFSSIILCLVQESMTISGLEAAVF